MLRLVFLYSPWKSTYFTPVDLEMLNFKCKRQHLKFRDSVLFYAWEDARVRALWIYFMYLGCLGPVILHSRSFLKVHHRDWLEWPQSDDCQVAGAFPFFRTHWLTLKSCNYWFHFSGIPLLVMNDHYWETFRDQCLSHVNGKFIPVQSKNSWYITSGVKFWTRPHQWLKFSEFCLTIIQETFSFVVSYHI